MNLLIAALIALIAWFFLEKQLIPRVLEMNFKKSKFAEITKVGWVAGLSYIRKFALIASITYSGLWVFLKVMNGLAHVFKDSEGIVSGLFGVLFGLNETLIDISDYKFIFILGILSIVFILLISRNARIHAMSVYEKIQADYDKGEIPNMEPSTKMNEVSEHITKAENDLKSISATPISNLNEQEQEKRAYYLDLLNQVIPALKAQWKELDIRRRIIPELEKEGNTKKTKKSWKEKLFVFFTSQGLIRSVYKTSKTLGTIGLVFILLSFLVAAKTVIIQDTHNTVKQIVDLQLEKQQQKIDEQWQETLAQHVNPKTIAEKEWTEEDEETLDSISRHFELAIARSFTHSLKPVSRAINFRLRANAVKQQVIQTFATTSEGKVRPGYEPVEQGSRLISNEAEINLSKKYSDVYSRNIETKTPTGDVGKQFKERFRSTAQSNKGVWESIKTNYRSSVKSFSTSATPKEVLGMILGESFEEVVKGTGKIIDAGSAEGKILEDMVGRTGNKTAKTWMSVKMNQFTDDLVHKSYPDALENAAKVKTPAEKFISYNVKDLDFPTRERVATNLSQHPPCIDHQPLNAKKIADSKSAIKNFSRLSSQSPALFSEAVTDFKYHFPGQTGMEMESAAAEFAGGGGGGGGSNPRNTPPKSKPKLKSGKIASSIPAGRARSFKALRGFRRIGGVLIGQEPTNTGNTGVDFRDISWKDLGSQMEIFMHRSDGKVISGGIYDKDIIHQALAYTADGRLITVTMVTGKPFPFLKILVHPTLVDTDLGCKAIDLDRMVDKYASLENDVRVKNAMESFQYQNLIYKYVSLKNTNFREMAQLLMETYSSQVDQSEYEDYKDLFLAQLEEKIKQEYEVSINQLAQQIKNNWSNIYYVLRKGEVFKDQTLSHIASKPNYYNKEVLSLIDKAFKNSNGRVESFLMAINSQKIYSQESLLKVDTEQWSGVRELPFEVDNELSFLYPNASQNSNLYPLYFMRQIVFNPTETNEDGTSAGLEQVDEEPWEFPLLKNKGIINGLVWQGIQSDESDKRVLARMQSFAKMQRIFRVAMSGDLGMNFPVEKLANLAKETRDYIITTPTPNWNSSGMKWHQIEASLAFDLEEEALQNYKLLWDSQEIEAEKNLSPCN